MSTNSVSNLKQIPVSFTKAIFLSRKGWTNVKLEDTGILGRKCEFLLSMLKESPKTLEKKIRNSKKHIHTPAEKLYMNFVELNRKQNKISHSTSPRH